MRLATPFAIWGSQKSVMASYHAAAIKNGRSCIPHCESNHRNQGRTMISILHMAMSGLLSVILMAAVGQEKPCDLRPQLAKPNFFLAAL